MEYQQKEGKLEENLLLGENSPKREKSVEGTNQIMVTSESGEVQLCSLYLPE